MEKWPRLDPVTSKKRQVRKLPLLKTVPFKFAGFSFNNGAAIALGPKKWLMRKRKCLVTKHFLQNHVKTIKISCQETTCPLSLGIFVFLRNILSGFVARQNLLKIFSFSEWVRNALFKAVAVALFHSICNQFQH